MNVGGLDKAKRDQLPTNAVRRHWLDSMHVYGAAGDVAAPLPGPRELKVPLLGPMTVWQDPMAQGVLSWAGYSMTPGTKS